jgi:glycosyltransferase involved in cell wall biosynthesis
VNAKVVVAWHNPKQKQEFLEAWKIAEDHVLLQMTQDENKSGCALTKNRGILAALEGGAEYVCVLDDDCYPADPEYTIEEFVDEHIAALKPQPVRMVHPSCIPHSRGMPYKNRTITMPVAASMGFWVEHLDLDAMSTLVYGSARVERATFLRQTVHGMYFPFCGMNFAFHRKWAHCAQLINIPRWDDIFMGWLWERDAYQNGACFNLQGPIVRHVRQSDPWANLRQEIEYLELNETLWQTIHMSPPEKTTEQLRAALF